MLCAFFKAQSDQNLARFFLGLHQIRCDGAGHQPAPRWKSTRNEQAEEAGQHRYPDGRRRFESDGEWLALQVPDETPFKE
jgi:hypothetical protein